MVDNKTCVVGWDTSGFAYYQMIRARVFAGHYCYCLKYMQFLRYYYLTNLSFLFQLLPSSFEAYRPGSNGRFSRMLLPRLNISRTAFFLCDIQEKLIPTINEAVKVLSVADRMVKFPFLRIFIKNL